MNTAINEICFGNIIINYEIFRTDRKTVGIVVKPDGSVSVKAPVDLGLEKIKETVFKKRKWIINKLQTVQEIKKPIPLKQELVSGEKIRLKNRLYRLKIQLTQNKRIKITFAFKILHIYINVELNPQKREEEIKRALIEWYKEKANNIINQRIQKYLKYLDYQPKDIKVRDQKIRWGSCTEDGKVIYNWRIVMAPVSAIDYVIVHELCHLKEPHHSSQFWENVESLFPNYKKWKEWLRVNGLFLDLRL